LCVLLMGWIPRHLIGGRAGIVGDPRIFVRAISMRRAFSARCAVEGRALEVRLTYKLQRGAELDVKYGVVLTVLGFFAGASARAQPQKSRPSVRSFSDLKRTQEPVSTVRFGIRLR